MLKLLGPFFAIFLCEIAKKIAPCSTNKDKKRFRKMQLENLSDPRHDFYLIGITYTITVNGREPVADIFEREINSSEQRTEVISRELTVVSGAI
jgi:hypothetical protein